MGNERFVNINVGGVDDWEDVCGGGIRERSSGIFFHFHPLCFNETNSLPVLLILYVLILVILHVPSPFTTTATTTTSSTRRVLPMLPTR